MVGFIAGVNRAASGPPLGPRGRDSLGEEKGPMRLHDRRGGQAWNLRESRGSPSPAGGSSYACRKNWESYFQYWFFRRETSLK